MKLLLVAVQILQLFYTSVVHGQNDTSQYHWESVVDRRIPQCAVPGGKNENGTTFIGRVPYDASVIPGEIYESPLELHYVTVGEAFIAKNNFEILCSKHPQRFEWIETTLRDLRFLTHKHLVQGGYDDDYPLLIGKFQFKDSEVIAKVTVYEKYEAIAFISKGEAYYRKEDAKFEVLAFNEACASNELHISVYY